MRYDLLTILFITIIILWVCWYTYTSYKEEFKPVELVENESIKNLKKKHTHIILHYGNEIDKFSKDIRDYSTKHDLDYVDTKNLNVWQTVITLFEKFNYEYIIIIPTNIYIRNKERSIRTLIIQAGDNDLILSRDEKDPKKISTQVSIFRKSDWTMFKLSQFYHKDITNDIILDQVYTTFKHKTWDEFGEYLDKGIPYMLTNICIFNEHTLLSTRSDLFRFYDTFNKEAESILMFPWCNVKHPRFVLIEDKPKNIIVQKSQTKIPKNIFQTMETNLSILNVKACIEQTKLLNPEYNYYYYNAFECRKFMKEHFNDIFEYYDLLIPGAYKADLWRYCVLYKYGGFYTDIRMYPYMSFDSIISDDTEFVTCIDLSKNMAYQAILGCAPGNKFIKSVINECIKNIKNRSNDNGCLNITGPGTLGIAINETLGRDKNRDLTDITDDTIHFLNWSSNKAPKYLETKTDIFSCHKYNKLLTDEEVQEENPYWLMLTGKDHYSVLYSKNKIYKHKLF